MKLGISTLVIFFLFVQFCSCSSREEETKKDNSHPNIIYILADDLGYGDLSCLNPESKIPTPNLDKLSEAGIIFTDAHSSSSVCSPTRYGILTGRYSWRTERQGGALWPFAPPLIEKDILTLPEYLKDNGYNTACIGKWHVGMNWVDSEGNILKNTGSEKGNKIDFSKPILNGPLSKGFDYYFGTDAPNYPPYCFIENDKTVGIPTIPKPDSIYGNPGIMLENWDLYNVLPEMEERVKKYIKDHAGKKKPFFLYLPLTAPHTPIVPNKDYMGKSQAGAYGDFVYQVDAIVGEILRTLERTNISKNTLIIFTSDNGSPGRDGTEMGGPLGSVQKYNHNPSYIFRGMKSDIWEGGHHVPFIAKWPSKIKAGTKSSEIICLTDLFATCAAIIDEELPNHAGVDSYNIFPAMTGENYEGLIREATVHLSENGSFAIRQGKWKLIMCPGSGGWSLPPEKALRNDLPMIQLYDLSEDISEQKNISDKHPEIVYKLTKLLEKYVEAGRSTPGIAQKNSGKPDIWQFLKIHNLKYNISLVDHMAANKTVKILNKAKIKFAGNGIDVLTDGIRATSSFDDGYWAGVEGDDLEILVDLGKNQNINKVSVGFLEAQNFWIFYPLNIEFALSLDGKEFFGSSDIGKNIIRMSEDREINDFSVKYMDERCRFIKIKARNIKICPEWHKGAGGKAWMFIDEIIIE